MKTATLEATLTDLFKRAEAAALAADPGDGMLNDAGTCNADSPAFTLPRVRKALIERAAQAAGITVTDYEWFNTRYFWVNVTTRGQANRRSLMAEAAYKVLREFAESGEIPGFRATMYYQMD